MLDGRQPLMHMVDIMEVYPDNDSVKSQPGRKVTGSLEHVYQGNYWIIQVRRLSTVTESQYRVQK
jgi:hypothetical protein